MSDELELSLSSRPQLEQNLNLVQEFSGIGVSRFALKHKESPKTACLQII